MEYAIPPVEFNNVAPFDSRDNTRRQLWGWGGGSQERNWDTKVTAWSSSSVSSSGSVNTSDVKL